MLTETACDLANQGMSQYGRLPEHCLEASANTPPTAHSAVLVPRTWQTDNTQFTGTQATAPLAKADVYVDDFLLVAQTKRHQRRLLRATLHAIDAVLQPLDSGDSVLRKEPTSVKKLQQGDDANWSTQKCMLGWDLDTVACTLLLPPHRCTRLYALLDMVRPPRKGLPFLTGMQFWASSSPWPPATRVRAGCSPYCKMLSAGATDTACG